MIIQIHSMDKQAVKSDNRLKLTVKLIIINAIKLWMSVCFKNDFIYVINDMIYSILL